MKNTMILLLVVLMVGCGRSGDLTMEDDNNDSASVSSEDKTVESVSTEQMITDIQVQSSE